MVWIPIIAGEEALVLFATHTKLVNAPFKDYYRIGSQIKNAAACYLVLTNSILTSCLMTIERTFLTDEGEQAPNLWKKGSKRISHSQYSYILLKNFKHKSNVEIFESDILSLSNEDLSLFAHNSCNPHQTQQAAYLAWR